MENEEKNIDNIYIKIDLGMYSGTKILSFYSVKPITKNKLMNGTKTFTD